jgi:hypothetical protein
MIGQSDNGRLLDEYYPPGYRHIEDHEIAVAGESMCCHNASVADPKQWTQITQSSALGINGYSLRQKWPAYTFAIKDTTKPIFNERILSKKTIEGFLEGERVPALDSDEQLLLLSLMAKFGLIEFEYY